MGFSFQFSARVLLYGSSHRLNNTYHSLCYTSSGALAGKRNTSMGPMNLTKLDKINQKYMDKLNGWNDSYEQQLLHKYKNSQIV